MMIYHLIDSFMRTLVIQYWFRQPAFWGLTWSKWSDIQTIFVNVNLFNGESFPGWRLDVQIQISEAIQEQLKSKGIQASEISIESVTSIT